MAPRQYLISLAKIARKKSLEVSVDRRYSTVSIGDVFMQGEEAEDFISEIDALSERFPTLAISTITLALAEPYDC